MNLKMATDRNAGIGIQNRQLLHHPIKTEIKPETQVQQMRAYEKNTC